MPPVSTRVTPEGTQWTVEIEVPEDIAPFVAYKGSIAVDGVSLTVASVEGRRFTVALIPETLKQTRFKELQVGSRVNIEVDLMARYLARLAEASR